jgi:putative FmdB family regulatory protein
MELAEGATVPTYQYACTECEHRFDAVQSFTDAALDTCPECSGRLRKLYGAVGIVFKGSGFYRTDSRSNGAGPNDSGSKDSGSKDSGSKESGSKESGSKDSGSKESGASGSKGSGESKGSSKASDSKAASSSTSTTKSAPATS